MPTSSSVWNVKLIFYLRNIILFGLTTIRNIITIFLNYSNFLNYIKNLIDYNELAINSICYFNRVPLTTRLNLTHWSLRLFCIPCSLLELICLRKSFWLNSINRKGVYIKWDYKIDPVNKLCEQANIITSKHCMNFVSSTYLQNIDQLLYLLIYTYKKFSCVSKNVVVFSYWSYPFRGPELKWYFFGWFLFIICAVIYNINNWTDFDKIWNMGLFQLHLDKTILVILVNVKM